MALTRLRTHPEDLDALTNVFDRLLEGCQIVDPEWRYLYLNDVAVVQSRQPREALIGRTMMQCYPGIETTAMFAALRRAMERRTAERLENRFTFPDGARIVYDLRMVPITEGVCIFSADVTERHMPPSAIVAGSGDAIIGRTLEGIITSWNHGAEQIFGYSAAEMIGQPFTRLAPEGLTEQARLAMTARLAGGEIQQLQATRRHKDGRALEIWATLSPVRDGDGNLVGISAIMRDVSELNRTQRELAYARDQLEATNRELTAFSYSLAHDLRTPLRAIVGFSQILVAEQAERLDAEGKEHLEQVSQAAQRMAALIDAMLSLARINRTDMRHEHVDLSALARAAHERLVALEPDRRVVVSVTPFMRATGDPALLGSLLDNLIGNAWKFTRDRSPGHIEVGRETVDGVAAYFVRDDGAGFDMAYAKKLFAPFQRLHSVEEFEGTGIGLATVQRIAIRHGGRVWARAAPNEGATFFFTLGPTEDPVRPGG